MYSQPNFSSESTVTRASTLLTSESSSSDGTEVGLGTLSGRAVMALGQVVLNRMEFVAIRQKINELRRVFPHDNRAGGEMEGHYRNLIELSRYFDYFTSISPDSYESDLTCTKLTSVDTP